MNNSGISAAYLTLVPARVSTDFETDAIGPEKDILIYPNPSVNGIFTVEIQSVPSDGMTYSIYALDGRRLEAGDVTKSSSFQLDLHQHPQGVYMLQLTTESGNQLYRLLKK
jgi:hypothetical protein